MCLMNEYNTSLEYADHELNHSWMYGDQQFQTGRCFRGDTEQASYFVTGLVKGHC